MVARVQCVFVITSHITQLLQDSRAEVVGSARYAADCMNLGMQVYLLNG